MDINEKFCVITGGASGTGGAGRHCWHAAGGCLADINIVRQAMAEELGQKPAAFDVRSSDSFAAPSALHAGI